MPLARQFVFAIALAALTTLPLLVVGNIPTLAVVLFCGGSRSRHFHHPMGLIERLVPLEADRGITWAMTGIGIAWRSAPSPRAT